MIYTAFPLFLHPWYIQLFPRSTHLRLSLFPKFTVQIKVNFYDSYDWGKGKRSS